MNPNTKTKEIKTYTGVKQRPIAATWWRSEPLTGLGRYLTLWGGGGHSGEGSGRTHLFTKTADVATAATNHRAGRLPGTGQRSPQVTEGHHRSSRISTGHSRSA